LEFTEHFMKKIIQLSAIGLLLAGCGKVPSDAQVRKKALGDWSMPAARSIMTIAPDGSFQSKFPGVDLTLQGAWRVEGGFFVFTVTNAVGSERHSDVGETQRFKIVSMNDHDLVLQVEGATNLVTAHKQ
jgi:hypothetical protein